MAIDPVSHEEVDMAPYEGRGLEIVRQEMNQGFRHIEKRLADEFHELRSSMHIIYSTAGGNLVNEKRNTESLGVSMFSLFT